MSVPAFDQEPLTPQEAYQVDYVIRGAQGGSTLAVAAALGGAFLVYRAYMRRRLRERMGSLEGTTPEEVMRETNQVFSTFMPTWTAMAAPALLQGYLSGVAETEFGLDEAFLSELADNYAYSLGMHINQVSGDALVRGYAAQVNRKVPAKVALGNVIDAVGVTNSHMRTLNVMLSGKEDAKLSETLIPSVKKARAQRQVMAALNQRAEVIGDSESWNAKQQGKQIAWLYAQRQGFIPSTATREWITADDERVCPSCGPLHKVELPVAEQFDIPNVGKFWSPPVHPRCRCDVRLKVGLGQIIANNVVFGQFGRQWLKPDDVEEVGKSDNPHDNDWDTQPRQKTGRFGARPEVRFKEADVDLDAAIAQATQAAQIEDAVPKGPILGRTVLGKPGVIGETTLGKPPVLGQVVLGKPPVLGGSKLESQGLQAQRMKSHALQGRKLDKSKLDHARRMARAEMDGRIMALPGDISGTVVDDEVKAPEPDYSDLVPTPEPMFAVADPRWVIRGPNTDSRSINASNGMYRLDGAEVIGGVDKLQAKIEELEAEADDEYLEYLFDSNEASYFDNETGWESPVPEHVYAAAMEWVRAQEQTNMAVADFTVELDAYGPLWTKDGTPVEGGYNHPDYEALYENGDIEFDLVDSQYVQISDIADKLSLWEHVSDTQPRIIQLDKVRGNDVDYDPDGAPYAQVSDSYKMDGMSTVTINGRHYVTARLEPAWLDEGGRM